MLIKRHAGPLVDHQPGNHMLIKRRAAGWPLVEDKSNRIYMKFYYLLNAGRDKSNRIYMKFYYLLNAGRAAGWR